MRTVFNKSFYSLRAVKKTIKTYQGLADFQIKEYKNTIEVIMEKIDKEIEEVIEDEFCNYVLAEMKK